MRKARTAARDFQSSLEDMIEDEEIREAKDSIERQARESVSEVPSRPGKRGAFDIGKSLENQVDPDGSLRKSVREIEHQARRPEPAAGSGGDAAPANGARSTSGAEGTDAVTAPTPVAPGHSINAAPHGDDPETGAAAEPARSRATTPSDSNA